MLATALNDASPEAPDLRIQTEVGTLRGTWRGGSTVKMGESVDLELEVPTPRTSSSFTRHAQSTAGGGERTLRGRIAAVFEDGVVVVQVGSAVLQIEMLDRFPGSDVGVDVELSADDLEFYPTGA